MKISRLSLWHVPLTSHLTYYMGAGKTCATVETVVVRVQTDTGIDGWGEVCPIPGYLPAYARGVAPAISEMADVILGADPRGPEALIHRLDVRLQGHVYVKSVVDIALWDITAKAAQLPLYTLLGGRCSEDMPLYHSLSCMEPDDMAVMAKDAWLSGIRQFQVKLGVDNDWQKDVRRLRQVREAVGEGPLVYGDWNCAASRLNAIRAGRAVADIDVMLEQPCATIEDCAAVGAATGLPMKQDETAFDTASLLRARELRCMDAVAIKLSKFGGLSASRHARDLCLDLGALMCIEDTWGSDITTCALLHLAASTPPHALLNTCDLSSYVSPRLDSNAPVRASGRIRPPDGAGLGVCPDLTALGSPDLVID